MEQAETRSLAEQLRGLETAALPAPLPAMLGDDARRRLTAANRRDAQAWKAVTAPGEWVWFRDERLDALRRSLGPAPAPRPVRAETTGRLDGDGFRIEKLVFETRPGLVATANLYLPEPPRPRMPAILLCHSHHSPKTQDELQDMGVNWARTGAAVLVMDQVGHGERRQQPFGGREDYRSRFVLGTQLHLVGESLMGWMAWDLGCGVDLLLARPGIDPEKILLIGSVAGGGDPAAVAAALDRRIACAVPFNFGGPQPETRIPLPPEDAFNYAGSGSWETTRNLRLSARDGFLPWLIVGAVAPRRLIYAHEFAWDKDRDPVWGRLQRVYGFLGAPEALAFAHGSGTLAGRPPEASHCNNVGPVHRSMIYPSLQRWFGMPPPEPEVRIRRKPEELAAMTPEAAAKLQPKLVHQVAADLAARQVAAARAALGKLEPAARRQRLRETWAQLLGDVEPKADPKPTLATKAQAGEVAVERLALEVEAGIVVPALLLRPQAERPPVVVAVAQEGKERLARGRADDVAALLRGGAAVCLPDVRGTGETRPDDVREGRFGQAPSIASTELMLGQTLVGSRLRDLRSVIRWLRGRPDLDGRRIALWGDALTPVNPEVFEDPPQDTDKPPHQAEVLGGLLALLGALFDEEVGAAVVRRGLVGFASVLASPFTYLPSDAVVPGVLTAGDLSDVAAALAPRPLRLEGLVDGRNREVGAAGLAPWLEPVRAAYAAAPQKLAVAPGVTDQAAAWLLAALGG